MEVDLPFHKPSWVVTCEALLKPKFQELIEMSIAMTYYHQQTRTLLALGEAVACLHGANSAFSFWHSLLPFIQGEALAAPERVKSLPVLAAGVPLSVALDRRAVSSLLACAFFSLYTEPRVDVLIADEMPAINWDSMLETCPEHTACVLHYFERLHASSLIPRGGITGNVKVTRQILSPVPDQSFWIKSTARLIPLVVAKETAIENHYPQGMLEAVFSNEYLGGGVLYGGTSQEEVRFLLAPETLVALLFTQKMRRNEAILIEGTERFNHHRGYGFSMEWAGDYQSDAGQPMSRIVCFDSLVVQQNGQVNVNQWTVESKLRELNKSFIAFTHGSEGNVSPIATGNWGCGYNGGCKHLKSVIQWMAASQAGREMQYFPFDDLNFGSLLADMCLKLKHLTVGHLAKILFDDTKAREGNYIPYVKRCAEFMTSTPTITIKKK